MKRLILLTITLLLVLTAVFPAAAFAEQGNTIYPGDAEFTKSLEFTNLTDYAVEGDAYYFSENGTISVYENGVLSKYSSEENEFEFPPAEQELTVGNYYYYFDAEGALTVHDKSSKQTETLQGGYGNLKLFGEKVYAVRANCLYELNGSAAQKIILEYADFSATEKISIGQTLTGLANYSLKFVTLNSGAYITEVDLTSLDGEYFNAGATTVLSEPREALLLCYTGNAALVAIHDSAYILLKSQTAESADNHLSQAEFSSATMTGNDIYSAPFVFLNPALGNSLGTVVTVTDKVECEDILGFVFYRVEYKTETGTAVGYVAQGLLSGIYVPEDNKQPAEITDPDYSEKNNVKTVIIVFCVVILVLAAVGYLAYVGTSGKNKKSKKQEQQPQQSENK